VGSLEAMGLPADTTLGAVSLTVRDLDLARSFYERALGLRTLESAGSNASLGVEDGHPLVKLHGHPSAPLRPPGTTGLYHLAVLVPTREDLARALRRLAEAGWRLVGAADHLVSEALYLSDPEGNGIEIYRDRPREQWERIGSEIRMATMPLDLQDLIAALGSTDKPDRGMPHGTRLGHVHLNVASLSASEAFYGGTVGFDVTARGYPGALFMSAGGYHHHIGLNTWAGEAAPPPPEGAMGLHSIEVALPDSEHAERRSTVADPDGNIVVFEAET
jgi:catechol 2,3-dioxygenase